MAHYMDEYNYHDWAKYMVQSSKNKPLGPHFAAVLFGTRTEWTPAYDQNDSDSTSTLPEITYFAFPNKEILGEWVLRAKKAKKEFFFFEVKNLGEAELSVQINLKI